MIHETVFCKNPKLAGLVSLGNFAGFAHQHKDLNEQYRGCKKSALAVTRNGQKNKVKKHYINDNTRYC